MNYIFVAIFGAAGAMARYGIGLLMKSNTIPYHTLLVNVLGSFLLALLMRSVQQHTRFPQYFVNGLGIGFIGAFTTFSAFSVENVQLMLTGCYMEAMVYVVVSLFGGLLAAGAGMYMADTWGKRVKQGDL